MTEIQRQVEERLEQQLFLTDGGLETTLLYREGMTLPHFASFPLLLTDEGCEVLRRYLSPYVDLANAHGVGFVFETTTWRANPDWGDKLGFSPADLRRVHQLSARLAKATRAEMQREGLPSLMSGTLGPRGDGYIAGARMTAEEAARYHEPQILALAYEGVDIISAFTLNYREEAEGIALAAKRIGIPVALSFTVETDGRLPSGESLRSAIESIDESLGGSPLMYMVNCAHPQHLARAFASGGDWLERVRGIRANASIKSHEELESSTELDDGDPRELASDMTPIADRLPALRVLGGCCGTDERHVAEIARQCLPALARRDALREPSVG